MTLKTVASRRTRTRRERPAIQFKKILVPVDFSPASKTAFGYALRFAKAFAAELTLFHVLARPVSLGGAAASKIAVSKAEKTLRELAASALDGRAGRARRVVRAGVPFHEIVEMAKEADVDLIMMATHGYTGWKHFSIGSTTERVVRAAPCPVFVLREKEHEFR
jgi:nucleotide-binding universal stress UspA family protein